MTTEAKDTGKRALSAGAWTVGSRLLAKLIDLAMLFCLARFLGPTEFGLVAMAMAPVFIIEALFELPIVAALVRVPIVTQGMLHTAFTLGVIRGILISCLLLLISVPLAQFNQEPRLTGLLAVLSLAPALRGLVSPRLVEYTRAFNFRPDAIMELSGKSFAFGVSILIALTTHSYWAIAAATVCSPFISTLISYIIAPMRPSFSLTHWKNFSSLIGWNFVSQFCSSLNWQVDRLLLPRFISTSSFGEYAIGKQISEIPIQALVTPLNRPAMAAFAASENNCGSRYLQLSEAVAFILIPVLGLLIIWPETVIRIGLGTAWTSASQLLQWVSVGAIFGIPAMLLAPLAMTLDRTKLLAIRTFLELVIRIPLVWASAVYFGVFGAIVASAFATTCGTIFAIFAVRNLIGASLASQILTMWRPLLAVIPSGFLLILCKKIIEETAGFGDLLILAVPLGTIYSLLYLIISITLWRLAGCPAGIEQQLINKLGYICRRFKPCATVFSSTK